MNQGRLILGVDPGFHGALCVLDPSDREIIAIADMPLLKASVFGTESRVETDLKELSAFLEEYGPRCKFAVVERVHASPQMGVTSAFRFGEGFGAVTGILAAFKIPARMVYPNVWKTGMGLIHGKKSDSRIAAAKILPAAKDFFKRARDDGRAEAALLALYGAQFFLGMKPSPVAGQVRIEDLF